MALSPELEPAPGSYSIRFDVYECTLTIESNSSYYFYDLQNWKFIVTYITKQEMSNQKLLIAL